MELRDLHAARALSGNNALSDHLCCSWAWSTYPVHPAEVHFPKTTEDVVAIVKAAKAKGLKVRSVGHAHSWSPIFFDEVMPLP
jgi:FAD/FMN-containing dehydrogenase